MDDDLDLDYAAEQWNDGCWTLGEVCGNVALILRSADVAAIRSALADRGVVLTDDEIVRGLSEACGVYGS